MYRHPAPRTCRGSKSGYNANLNCVCFNWTWNGWYCLYCEQLIGSAPDDLPPGFSPKEENATHWYRARFARLAEWKRRVSLGLESQEWDVGWEPTPLQKAMPPPATAAASNRMMGPPPVPMGVQVPVPGYRVVSAATHHVEIMNSLYVTLQMQAAHFYPQQMAIQRVPSQGPSTPQRVTEDMTAYLATPERAALELPFVESPIRHGNGHVHELHYAPPPQHHLGVPQRPPLIPLGPLVPMGHPVPMAPVPIPLPVPTAAPVVHVPVHHAPVPRPHPPVFHVPFEPAPPPSPPINSPMEVEQVVHAASEPMELDNHLAPSRSSPVSTDSPRAVSSLIASPLSEAPESPSVAISTLLPPAEDTKDMKMEAPPSPTSCAIAALLGSGEEEGDRKPATKSKKRPPVDRKRSSTSTTSTTSEAKQPKGPKAPRQLPKTGAKKEKEDKTPVTERKESRPLVLKIPAAAMVSKAASAKVSRTKSSSSVTVPATSTVLSAAPPDAATAALTKPVVTESESATPAPKLWQSIKIPKKSSLKASSSSGLNSASTSAGATPRSLAASLSVGSAPAGDYKVGSHVPGTLA